MPHCSRDVSALTRQLASVKGVVGNGSTGFRMTALQRGASEVSEGMGKASMPLIGTADQAMDLIRSGDRVYLHEAAMAPLELIDALVRRAPELKGVETISLHTEGAAPHVAPRLAGSIRHNALFVGANVREAV